MSALALGWPAFMPMPWEDAPTAASPSPLFHLRPWAIGVWVVLVLALLTVINYRYKRQATAGRPSTADEEDISLLDMSSSDLGRAFELQAEAVDSGKMTSLPMFISLVLQPEKSRMRTVETVSLEGRVIVQDVKIEISLSDALVEPSWMEGFTGLSVPAEDDSAGNEGASETYVPILNCSKKEMIDNFQVRDREGRSVDILCYEETLQLISSSLHFLVHAALRQTPRRGAANPDGIDAAEAIFLMLTCGNKPIPHKTIEKMIAIALFRIGINAQSDIEPRNVTWLKEFVRTLARSTPVVAVISDMPDSRRLQISYSRTTIPPNKSKHLRHWIRLMLGLRPVTLQMAPDMAFTSKSYHLQVRAPESQYLMEQTLRCTECEKKLSGSEVETDGRGDCAHIQSLTEKDRLRTSGDRDPYFQLLLKRGQNYAHLYTRDFSGLQWKKIKVSVSFGEVPPGTLASAVITAVTSFLLIVAVAIAEVRGIERDSDIPAVLLVLPAIAASWFGFSSDTEAILRSSLAARCSLILGGFVSIAASIVFVVSGSTAQKGGAEGTAQAIDQVSGTASLMGIEVRWWWLVLIYLASANLVYVLIQSIIRSNSYRRLLRKETVFNENAVS
ncbi:hypothetical protein [Streptosporangium subroseum]|nr:hypothetical protein [Streptosporangium subroseum]